MIHVHDVWWGVKVMLLGILGAALFMAATMLYQDWRFLHAARLVQDAQELKRHVGALQKELEELKKTRADPVQ